MVPTQGFALKEKGGEKSKDNKGNNLLNDFELKKGEGTAVRLKTDAVGRHLKGIFKKRHAPRKEDDGNKRPIISNFHLLQLEMPIPSKSHEDIRENKEKYCV